MPAATPGGPQAGEAARSHAFAAIRQAILSGDLAPGRRLVEEDLASALGVTRQSLRAALRALPAEGLVERVPNRGARVRVVTAEEAVAITECRMALEALCAVKAAQCITDDEAAQLRELGEDIKRAVADGNPHDANLAVRAHLASVIEALQASDQADQPAGATADHDIPRYVESRSPGVPGLGQPNGT